MTSDEVSIDVGSYLLLNAVMLPDDDPMAILKAASAAEKQRITHHLMLSVSGPSDKVDIIGALLGNDMCTKADVEPITQWAGPKPYIPTISSRLGTFSLDLHFATVDDLRTLLVNAEKNGVVFTEGQKQEAMDYANKIMGIVGNRAR